MKFKITQCTTQTMLDDYIKMHDGYEGLKTFDTRADAVAYVTGFIIEYVEHVMAMNENLADDVQDMAGSYSLHVSFDEEGNVSVENDGVTAFTITPVTDATFLDLYK